MRRLEPGTHLDWPAPRARFLGHDPGLVLAALLVDAGQRPADSAALIHSAATGRDGLTWQVGSFDLDLTSVPPDVMGVLVIVHALRPADGLFLACHGARVPGPEVGPEIGVEIPVPLATVAVVAEFRRSGDHWLLAVPQSQPVSRRVLPGGVTDVGWVRGAAAPEVAGADAVRLASLVLEDSSRCTAARRSTLAYAADLLAEELENLYSDPEVRARGDLDSGRAACQRRHDDLVERATDMHLRDLATLTSEVVGLERRLAPPLARWESPRWRDFDPKGASSSGLRVGEVALPEVPNYRVPLITTLPMFRPAWVDTAAGDEDAAARVATVLATRIALASGVRGARFSVIDVGGWWGDLGLPDRLLAHPPATDLEDARLVLEEHSHHVELMQMAIEAGAGGAAPWRILLVLDFPHGLDDRCLRLVNRIAQAGGPVGVQIVFTGDRVAHPAHSAVARLQDVSLRLTCTPGGDLVDAYGEVDWVFIPDPGPEDALLEQLWQRLD